MIKLEMRDLKQISAAENVSLDYLRLLFHH